MNDTFNYQTERQIMESYKEELPELTPFFQNYWKNRTRFTMMEIIPILGNCMSEYYGHPYIIRYRYILVENPIKKVLDGQKEFHLSIEYYGIPTNECFTFPNHMLPNHIKYNERFYQYRPGSDHNITLTPMTNSEIRLKEKAEEMLEMLKRNKKVIWIGTEEHDIGREELEQEQTWMGRNIPLEERNMINNELILNAIIQYIENRENQTLPPKMDEGEINSILNDYFKNSHKK